ncbi:hypothetical protein PEP31012_00740 [Pandoraea eparura]|uniref:Zinc finger/thioredoxin putative domain-containing protein n=1 Tax=Pandoraea eparura TaxID=2508291 RepID=A0A5E4SEH6_9BURK|nr:DUF3426 domain-containing protein [Pandoraea eparura]VVD73561.1 hypothetical protein PEP31012_00740 [Pandoraea eparura]
MPRPSRVLATRCPHCHTVFRVVADQLKLRDGLVRCGTCREVFDGQAYLCEPPGEAHESDTASPDAMSTSSTDVEANADANVRGDAADTADAADAPDTPNSTTGSISQSDMSAAWPTSPVPHETPVDAAPAPANEPATSAERPAVPEMLTPTAIAALLGTPDESRAQMRHGPGRYIDDDATTLAAPTASMASPTSAMATDAPTSSRLGGHPSRPGASRMVWRLLIALAIAGLLAQWAWIERAALVDRVPALRGVFAAIGRPIHVTIAPPRQPDKVQISSVTLVTDAPGTTDVTTGTPASNATSGEAVPMTLTVFIRNQADYAVAWPSLELTLSDIDGKPVVRRVFSASDYVADATLRVAGLAPHNERTIRLRLTAQAALASNYRVLAFYP